jgi:glycosyltransferase involved in cell wall biosynthesis
MIQQITQHNVTAAESHQRPTICHVIHAMGVGGAEVLVDRMVRGFSAHYNCIVAVLDDIGEIGEQLRNDGFVVEHMHRVAGIDRKCAARLDAFSKQHQVDILHAHQYTPFFQAMLSRGLAGKRPVLFTEHGRHFPDRPSRKRSIANRLMLRSNDRLVGCGRAVRQALIDNEGLPADRVQVIYNGVDLDALAAAPSDARATIRSEFGMGADDFVAVLVARLHQLKDHQTALRAVELARKTIPELRLLLAGDGEERPFIEQTIRDSQLEDGVTLAGSRSDVASLLAASDAFLMTSISEGIPLTIIEAMAAGLPVVSTAVGGIPEMIEHGTTGLLAQAGDHQALADALIQLHRNPDQRSQIAEAGRQRARQQFSLNAMLDGYRQLYEEMLGVKA